MYIHVALFRWKRGTKPAAVTRIVAALRKLSGKIPGVISVRAGKNFSRSADGYTHGVVVVAKTRPALTAYRNHPAHRKIVAEIEQTEARSLGFDFRAS